MKSGFLHGVVVVSAIALGAMSVLLAPAAVSTTRAAERTLNDAVKKLVEEITSAKGNDDLVDKLRSQSNFFDATAAGKIPATALLDALEDPPTRDPRVQSYVNWQLLSAAPDRFDEASVSRAIAIYRNAPGLSPRPGIADADKQELDQLLARATRDDVYGLSKQLEQLVERNAAANRFHLAYRDELIRRLPISHGALMARLEDLFERYQAGLERKMMQDALVSDLENFARDLNATKRQLQSLAETLDRMLREQGPSFYVEAEFRDGQVRWRTQRDSLKRSKKLKDLIKQLRDESIKPRGGLKFKDE